MLGEEVLGALGVLLGLAHLFHDFGDDVLAQRTLNAPRLEGEQEAALGGHEPLVDAGPLEEQLCLSQQGGVALDARAVAEIGQADADESAGLPEQLRRLGSGEEKAQALGVKLVELRQCDTA